MGKKNKIEKSSIASPAARAAIARCADELSAYATDDGSVAGLVTKLRASLEGPVDHAPGDMPTMTVTKLEESLTDLAKMDQSKLSPETRERVHQAMRAAQVEYLHQQSPVAAANWEAAQKVFKADADRARTWQDDGDDSDARAKAEKLQKADPTLSPFQALERAYRAHRAA